LTAALFCQNQEGGTQGKEKIGGSWEVTLAGTLGQKIERGGFSGSGYMKIQKKTLGAEVKKEAKKRDR